MAKKIDQRERSEAKSPRRGPKRAQRSEAFPQRTKGQMLFNQARKFLVGGVDSPVRSFRYVGIEPVLAKKGKGAYLWDYDNNKYVDYVLSWGSLILGHSHPGVIRDLKKTANYGLSFGLTNVREIELAQILKKAIPFIDKIRFVNSGTEAVMSAIRLARGYTGRDKILKFENYYHGHVDYLLAKAGSGLLTQGIAQSSGVPKDFIKHTIVAPFGDSDIVERIFTKEGKNIAAVIVEPIGGNSGVVLPNPDFLKKLRKITQKYGTLLIFDEVITGFRFNFGSVSERFGVVPDLICLGKIIGGGLPIGAYGAKNKIMSKLAPQGDVYQASTFSGNPIVMQAGITTLKALANLRRDYRRLADLTALLSNTIKEIARAHNVNLEVNHFGSMFSLKFSKKEDFKKFYKGMLESGVYFAPSEFEANFLSFAHTRKDIGHTISLVRRELWKI